MFKHLSIEKVNIVLATYVLSLAVVNLMPASAAPSTQLITCVDLDSGKERISKTGTCRSITEAMTKWHLAKSDSALASGKSTKTLTVCSNKENSVVTYQLIRASCAKHMQLSLYTRSSVLPARPVITQVFSTSHESASLALASDPASNLDAPIAYYTITSSKGDVVRVNSWRELTVSVSGLMSSTSYSFTITATNADGTSPVSESSSSVTTQVYVAKVASSPALTCATGGTCVVGDRGPGGGIVFYVSAAGFNCGPTFSATGSPTNGKCHYLEAAANTWNGGISDPRISWATDWQTDADGDPVFTPVVGANSTQIGSGYKNSLAIGLAEYGNVALSSAAVAARSYTSLVSGVTYSDWYLPSTDELNVLYGQRTILGTSVGSLVLYWSSSEGYASNGDYWPPWGQYFNNGSRELSSAPFEAWYCRPIRSF